MDDRSRYMSLVVHKAMLDRVMAGQIGQMSKIIMRKKTPEIADVAMGFFGDQKKWADAQPLRDFIRDTRGEISSIRIAMRPERYAPVSKSLREAETKAGTAVRARMNPKSPTKAYPSIRCHSNQKPGVVENDNGGVAKLSANWMRSVHNKGIAIVDLQGGDIALVVQAKHYPSVFLAEMGVTCFEAEAMRLGVKAKRVEGYVFHVKLMDRHHAILHPDFRRGVAAIKERIDTAFHEELGKVQ